VSTTLPFRGPSFGSGGNRPTAGEATGAPSLAYATLSVADAFSVALTPSVSPWAYDPSDRQDALNHPYRPGVFDFSAASPSFMARLVRFALSSAGGPTSGPTLSQVGFSPFDLQIWRGGRSLGGTPKLFRWFAHLGDKWGRAIALYFKRVPSAAVPPCLQVLRHAGSLDEGQFVAFLKGVSVICAARNLSHGQGWWTYLCDLHVLGGYDTCLNRTDVLSGYDRVAGAARPSILCPRLVELISETVRLISVSSSPAPSFEEFVEFRDAWALPGACTIGSPAKLLVRGQPRRVRGKFANLLATPAPELARDAVRLRPALIYPFRKADEPAKTRVVQSYDTYSYLRCSYLDHFFTSYNGSGTPWTTLGLSASGRSEMNARIAGLLSSRDTYGVSIDQSSFDEAQSKDAVRLALSLLFDHALASCSPAARPGLSALRDAELYSFDHAEVWRKDGARGPRKICSWLQGVPSGHKFTGLIDSILNRAETLWAAEKLGVRVFFGAWQGDDCALIVDRPTSASDWADVLARKGLVANPLKTGVSAQRLEYLHEVHGPEGTWALPARAFKSILWRRPDMGSSSFSPRHEQLSAEWDTLLKCSRRGLVTFPLAVASVSQELRKSKQKDPRFAAISWLVTPRVMGGGGWGTAGRTAGSWTVSRVRWKKVELLSCQKMGPSSSWVRGAILRRLGLATPLPAAPAVFSLSPVPRAFGTPPAISLRKPLRYDWTVKDVPTTPDAWLRKLRLEDKLIHGGKIDASLVPRSPLRHSAIGVDRAVRLLARWSGWKPCFETRTSSGSPFSLVVEFGASAWASFLARCALSGVPLKAPDRTAVDKQLPQRGQPSLLSFSSDPIGRSLIELSYFCFKLAVFGPVGSRTAV